MWSAVEEGLLEEVHVDSMSFSATLHYKFAHDKVNPRERQPVISRLIGYIDV
jgi:hypothetical protein